MERRRQGERAQTEAARAQARTDRLTEAVRELEYSVQKLTEINQALWEIVKETFKLGDDYLARWVDEIHRRNAETRANKAARLCKRCARPLERRQPNCLYCGEAAATDDDVFSTL